MSKTGSAFPFLLIGALVACTAPRSSIGDAAFQKRRHQPGWHMALGAADKRKAHASVLTEATPHAQPQSPFSTRPPEPRLITARTLAVEVREVRTDHQAPAAVVSSSALQATASVRSVPRTAMAQDPRTTDTEPRWNPWSLPAFMAAMGTAGYGVLGTSAVVMILAVALTLTLSIVAVRRGRMNEWRGKGFAITALILGTLAAFITLIAVLHSGL